MTRFLLTYFFPAIIKKAKINKGFIEQFMENNTPTKISNPEIGEVKNSNNPVAEKILYAVFFSLIIAAVAITYYKYFISRNYYIEAEADCDPVAEKCFIYQCDPAEDSECSEDPAEQISYYKIIKKKAYLIPLCDPNSEDCPALACEAGEDCEEILCSPETATEGEECNDPEQYLKENPPESDLEEGADETCSEGDSSCSGDESSDLKAL